LFGLGASVSAALLLTAVVACTRAQWTRDDWLSARASRFFLFSAGPDGISLSWLRDVPAESMPPTSVLGWKSVPTGPGRRTSGAPEINVPDRTRRVDRFAGVTLASGQGQILQPRWFGYRAGPLLPYRKIGIAWPTLIIASAVWPALWSALRVRKNAVRRERRRFGLCPDCGYDLRGTSRQCPECGANVSWMFP
jgi:hypothetical protein